MQNQRERKKRILYRLEVGAYFYYDKNKRIRPVLYIFHVEVSDTDRMGSKEDLLTIRKCRDSPASFFSVDVTEIKV